MDDAIDGAMDEIVTIMPSTLRVFVASVDAPFGISEPMLAKRRRRLLAVLSMIGLATVGALTLAVATTGVPAMEKHLADDVRQSIAPDAPNVQVRARGRTILLSGVVPSRQTKNRIVERAAARWGVDHVDSAGLTLPRTT